MQDNAKESFMVSFRLLHSHLTALANNDSKGTCIMGGFEWAFMALFDQDIQTFTGSMESIMEIAKHKREKDRRVNDSMMQSKERKDNSSAALDAVTPLYFPKVRESVFAKPHHVIAPGSSRNSFKESYGSNDMAHNYYLDEAKKKTQDKNKNLKHREMPSARTHNTPNTCTPKPRSNNQTSMNWPASKSCEKTQKADHSRNPSSFSDFKHFVCLTCQKCVFNANHDACITKFLKKVNSRAKIQPNKTRNSSKPVDPTSHTQKPGRKIVTGHSVSPNTSFVVHEKTKTPRSCLRWILTGRIFNTVGLKWVLTGKTFTSSIRMVDCKPPNSLNYYITNPYKCDQTLNDSAGDLVKSSAEGESIESYYHRFLRLMNDLKRNKHFPEKIASNLKFLNNLQPEWSRHFTIFHQTKDLHIADYTQLYDFLKYNQKENIGNQNGLIGVPGNGNQNGNGNLVVARAEGNAARHNGNQIRCYNCRGLGHYARNCTVRPRRRDAAYLQTQLLIA
nr:retrovirus-related Pol polyprotein from transposon TNT 1-94 [Tanacetum cinerariifolium]